LYKRFTGLNPQQFVDEPVPLWSSTRILFLGSLGHLTHELSSALIFLLPITLDPGLKTPHTQSFHLLQRELTTNLVVQAGLLHRDIRDMLGGKGFEPRF